ncbi:type II secretion system protein GspE [Bhargavaea cecembensis]|uniref:Type II secretion system protein GspE n=1 Tax=Bhargavaea cecembensis TaxID=394098 RepID=A0A163GBH2_9BACL|nr:GspE/PulE family protein [Bhargavaea cecembensis]KZE39996.1 type II secretion system protein GspE [Bhargavaea cecembensis]
MVQARMRLGDMLIESGHITAEQLETVLKEKPKEQRLGEALVQKGFITDMQLVETLELQLGIPHVNLFRYPFEPQIFSLVSKEFAKRNLLVPLKIEGDKLFVAMINPTDYIAIEDLRLSTGFQIEPVLASQDDIQKTIAKFYEETFDDLFIEDQKNKEEDEESLTDLDSPIVRLVNQILSAAVVQKASDIHFDPREHKVLVRFRVDGMLKDERALPKHMQAMVTARIKIMSGLDITEHRVPQDGRIKTNVDFRPIDLRVSSLPTVYGEKIVMRILDLSSSLTDMGRLGFNRINLDRFTKEIMKPSGIVLISGPTGSGKSSTLYAALNQLNREEVNIITVEDPVEYQLGGINQVQVNSNVGMTFAAGLRSILRQDPDIIMVGEIRDRETVDIAVRASLTGHLVLSTIHTNDSVSTITRLLDMGVEPFLVTASLNAVVAQRLLRRVCRDCGEKMPATEREREISAKRGIKIEEVTRGAGCPSCNMSGYRGRIAIHEVLVVDDDMRSAINRGEGAAKMKEIAIRNKTIFLMDDGLLKVKQGITTTEEVFRVAMLD